MNAPVNPTREALADVSQYQQRSRIFRGMSFSREEIALACAEIERRVGVLSAELRTFTGHFDAENQVECKLAAERVAEAARAVAIMREPGQVEELARSLSGTFATHLARRPRA